MAAGMKRINADLRMDIGRGADVNDIDGKRILQQLPVAGVHAGVRQAVTRLFLFRFLRIDINQRNDPAALSKLQITLNMVMGDISCSHNGDI